MVLIISGMSDPDDDYQNRIQNDANKLMVISLFLVQILNIYQQTVKDDGSSSKSNIVNQAYSNGETDMTKSVEKIEEPTLQTTVTSEISDGSVKIGMLLLFLFLKISKVIRYKNYSLWPHDENIV